MAVSQHALRHPDFGHVVSLLVVIGAGATLTVGPPWAVILLGLSAATLCGVLLYRLAGSSIFGIEVPLVLLLSSTTVWRIRSSMDLADNPLDTAGTVRIGQILLATLLALLALLLPRAQTLRTPLPTPWWLYAAYILVVFLGAPLSVDAPITAYRGVELAAGFLLLLAARRVASDGLARVEATLYWATVVGLAAVWAGVVLFPKLAVGHLINAPVPIPWQIQGVYPVVSSNSVGTSGVLLFFWTIGRAPHRWPGRRWRPATLSTLGVASLLAAQYRTGYVIFAVGIVVLLAVRRRWILLILLAALLCFLLAYKPGIVADAAPYALRGATVEQAKGLNSRISWWSAALPAWQESPLLGKGLLTGTRFEVLPRLGLVDVSSIHGTWVEALVGTGIVGCGLLALAYLLALWRSISSADHVALLVLMVILVRSMTGSSIESFGAVGLLFLWAACPSEVRDRVAGLPTPSLVGSQNPESRMTSASHSEKSGSE